MCDQVVPFLGFPVRSSDRFPFHTRHSLDTHCICGDYKTWTYRLTVGILRWPFTSYPIRAVVLAPMARSVGVNPPIYFTFSGGPVRLVRE